MSVWDELPRAINASFKRDEVWLLLELQASRRAIAAHRLMPGSVIEMDGRLSIVRDKVVNWPAGTNAGRGRVTIDGVDGDGVRHLLEVGPYDTVWHVTMRDLSDGGLPRPLVELRDSLSRAFLMLEPPYDKEPDPYRAGLGSGP